MRKSFDVAMEFKFPGMFWLCIEKKRFISAMYMHWPWWLDKDTLLFWLNWFNRCPKINLNAVKINVCFSLCDSAPWFVIKEHRFQCKTFNLYLCYLNTYKGVGLSSDNHTTTSTIYSSFFIVMWGIVIIRVSFTFNFLAPRAFPVNAIV